MKDERSRIWRVARGCDTLPSLSEPLSRRKRGVFQCRGQVPRGAPCRSLALRASSCTARTLVHKPPGGGNCWVGPTPILLQSYSNPTPILRTILLGSTPVLLPSYSGPAL